MNKKERGEPQQPLRNSVLEKQTCQFGVSAPFTGSIHLILGPMFSGKTTELMRRVRREIIAERKCLVIKSKKDERYSIEQAATHDRQLMRADVSCTRLSEVTKEQIENAEVIAVDEGQFFEDLTEFCEAVANQGKECIVAALDGTFQRKPFPNVIQLVCLAEGIVKLDAVCMSCRKNTASFSGRTVHETKVELVGGSESYKALCRRCYHTATNQVATTTPAASQTDCPNSGSSTPFVQDVALPRVQIDSSRPIVAIQPIHIVVAPARKITLPLSEKASSPMTDS